MRGDTAGSLRSIDRDLHARRVAADPRAGIAKPGRRVALRVAAAVLLAGCGSVYKFPDPSVQPTLVANGSLEAASESHRRWLEEHRPYHSVSTSAAGRASARPQGIASVDADRPAGSIAALLERNRALTEYYRREESQHYRSASGYPDRCVALSGGGIRATAFALGVLQGLNDRGELKDVDVISAVSGGSYALAWYLMNRLDGKSDDQVLDSGFIDKAINPSLLSLDLVVIGILGSPLDLLTDGSIFDNGIASTGMNTSYLVMLQNSFGIPRWSKIDDARMREAVHRGDIPLSIVGISAFPLLGDSPRLLATLPVVLNAKSTALFDTYFEVTPFRRGVNGFGFFNTPLTPLRDLWDFVTLSGAAYDQPFTTPQPDDFLSKFRLGGVLTMVVGTRFPQPASSSDRSSFVRQSFYASDGGFSENLAAFPLVMRRCANLILVDSEYDPDWRFEGYGVLKQRLKAEHAIDFRVPAIDDRMIATVDEYETRLDGAKVPARRKDDSSCARPRTAKPCAARSDATPKWEGFATLPPETEAEAADPRTSRVTYIKLGLPRADTLPPEVGVAHEACMTAPTRCRFPHDFTHDPADPGASQRYTREQFHAYRALGRALAHAPVAPR